MISSIRVNGLFNVKVNGNSKIKVGDVLLHTEKEVPFVRYRLDMYDDNTIEYIKNMQLKFPKSTHLTELELNDNTLQSFRLLRDSLSVAIYLYIDITEDIVKESKLPDSIMTILDGLQGCNFDRYMLRDKSISLDFMTAQKIMTQISKTFKIKMDNIGLCSSPLSFQGLQCLSAVKARELMSIYNENSDVPLPSANHECMNCCGCIRYLEVTSDLEAPSEGPKKSSNKTSGAIKEPKENKQPKKKVNKASYIPGRFSF